MSQTDDREASRVKADTEEIKSGMAVLTAVAHGKLPERTDGTTATQRKAQIRIARANLTSENEQLRIEERQERFGEDVWKNSPFDPTKDVQKQTEDFAKAQSEAKKAFLEQGKMKREADRKTAADAKAAKKKEEDDAKAAKKEEEDDTKAAKKAAKPKAKGRSRARVHERSAVAVVQDVCQRFPMLVVEKKGAASSRTKQC